MLGPASVPGVGAARMRGYQVTRVSRRGVSGEASTSSASGHKKRLLCESMVLSALCHSPAAWCACCSAVDAPPSSSPAMGARRACPERMRPSVLHPSAVAGRWRWLTCAARAAAAGCYVESGGGGVMCTCGTATLHPWARGPPGLHGDACCLLPAASISNEQAAERGSHVGDRVAT